MDITNITTPADLERLNNEQPTEEEFQQARGEVADHITGLCMEAGVEVGHDVCIRLVQANISLHKKNLAERAKADTPDPIEVILWTQDLERLEQALRILQQVDVG